MMKLAFPMTNEQTPRLFLKIKSLDSEKLDECIEHFMSDTVNFLLESKAIDHDIESLFDSLRVQVGHAENNCVLMIPFDSNEVFLSIAETIEKLLAVTNDTGLKMVGSVGLGMTLKNIVDYVTSSNSGEKRRT